MAAKKKEVTTLTLDDIGVGADEVGLAYTYVGQIERGRRNPTLDVVERFAAALSVDPLLLLKSAT